MAYYKKPKVPYEIKNAREWDPKKKLQHLSLSDDEIDENDDDDTKIEQTSETPASSIQDNVTEPPKMNAIGIDDDGFQKVVRRFKKHSANVRRENASNIPRENNRLSSIINRRPSPSVNIRAPPSVTIAGPTSFSVRRPPSVNSNDPSSVNVKAQTSTNPKSGKVRNIPTTIVRNTIAQEVAPLPSKTPQDEPYKGTRSMFNFERDNTARVAFRQRQEAAGSFELHKDIIEIEPDPSRLQEILQDLGVRFGTFIRPPQTGNDRKLLIWGNPKQLASTRKELTLWIRKSEEPQSHKSKAKERFATVHSTIGDKYKAILKETLKKADIARFQQNPDPQQHFDYGGVYRWPLEDVDPQEIFGSNLEAFDQVRYALKSHIVFDHRLEVIRVFSDKDGAVTKALKLVEGTLREFHARSVLDSQTKSVLLVDPSQCKITSLVRLQQRRLSSTIFRIPVLENGTLNGELNSEWQNKAREITLSGAARMQQELQVALSNLKYFRGHVRIKLHFGIFALTRFRWSLDERPSSVPLEEFLNIIAQPGTSGTLVRNLYSHRTALDILNMIMRSKDIFVPLDSSVESLQTVAPSYGARFEIHRFEKSSLQLEVDMTKNSYEEDLYEKTQLLWSNAEQKGNILPLNLFTIRLGADPSWTLEISRENQFERSRIDDKMNEFADSVRLNKFPKEGAELDGRKLIRWETDIPGCLKPSVFEQKIAFRYRVKHLPEAIFEIARYDSYDLASDSQMPSVTSWGSSMWNTEWDMKLSKNANLSLGENAGWDPKMEVFFPCEDPEVVNKQSQLHEHVNPGLLRFLQHVQPIVERLGELG